MRYLGGKGIFFPLIGPYVSLKLCVERLTVRVSDSKTALMASQVRGGSPRAQQRKEKVDAPFSNE